MRVAQCIRSDAFAGAERYVTNLAVGLAAEGCEVVVIGGHPDRMTAALDPAGVEWRPASTTAEVLRRLVAARPFDLVHAHMTAAEVAAVLATPALRAPVVATRHFALHRGSNGASRLVGRFVTTRLGAQLAVSRYVAERTEGPCTVVAPGTLTRVRDPGSPPPAAGRAAGPTPRAGEADRSGPAGLAAIGTGRGGLVAVDRGPRPGAGRPRGPRRRAGHRRVLHVSGREERRRPAALAGVDLPGPPTRRALRAVGRRSHGGRAAGRGGGGGRTPRDRRAGRGAALYDPADTAEAGRLLAALAGDAARRAAYGAALQDLHARCFTIGGQVAATLEIYRGLLPAPAPTAARR